ncbi:7TM-DISM domain-containing protein [Jiulongibacter sp. NS-SX5]|uniref:7TM-DISM domain-containing protein n=1 Tax=Jiulongibacter sp. NS-SX5 TaxID=3463854 RepID=UPI0040590378
MLRYLPLLLLFAACSSKDQKVINTFGPEVDIISVEYLVSENEGDHFEEIKAKGKFQAYSGSELNFGHLRKPVWIKINLVNQTDDLLELYLSSDQFILEDVQFWHLEDSVWKKEESGWGRSVTDLQVPSYLHAFNFTLPPLTTQSVYFRVQNKYQVVRVPLTLFSKKGFYTHHHKNLIEDGLVLLALITSIFFSVYNFFFTTDQRTTISLYFIYAFNFLVFFYFRVASPAFISEPYPIELNYYINICIFISTYTFQRFAIAFVNTEKKTENKLIKISIDVLFGLTIFFSLFPDQEGNSFFFAVKLSFFVLNIVYLLWYLLSSLRDNILARIYIVMALPLVFSGLVEGLTNVFGVLRVPNQFFEAFRLSICLEMLFILFALIYREYFLAKIVEQKLKDTEYKLLNTQLEIQETEQKRIAGDLHDDLGGTLSTLKRFTFDKLLPLASPADAQRLKFLAKKAGDDLRRISHSLMPPDFKKEGLVDAVRELTISNSSEYRRLTFAEHGERIDLVPKNALHVYRIISEIIQNVNKHSDASKVEIQFLWSLEDLTVMVEDNGSPIIISSEGLGMKNIQMRTEYLKGSINFDSNGDGNTIILEIPLA